ncbi:hypothetical protein LP414_28000 [Polaromonas sp. P1(28)-13]|nr:hypothetical protein LP414_28000 [Polaromonas sp. P1(28)-13]
MEIASKFMKHEGGTKYYEMVMLSHQGQGLLIKRFGPMKTHLMGSGQTKLECGSTSVMVQEMNNMVGEKGKVRSGTKYELATTPYKLHDVPRKASWTDIKEVARLHYYDREVYDAIVSYFGFLNGDHLNGDQVDVPETRIVTEPEPVRDASWGGW